MFEVSDNPFAIQPRSRFRPLVTSLKGLLLVAALLVVVLVAQSQTRQWLLARWLAGMSTLPAEQQIDRLKQIHALGDLATETLAQQIAADDPAVAATAYELVRERQSAWSLRDDQALSQAHRRMLDGLAAIIADLPPERLPWITELINQTILECVDQRGEAMHQTYAQANALAARLGNSAGAEPHSTVASADHLPPPSLVPLPVRLQSLSDEPAVTPAAARPELAASPVESEPPAEPQRPALVTRTGTAPVAVTALETQSSAPAVTTAQAGATTAAQRWPGTAEATTTQALVSAGALQAVHRVATEEPERPAVAMSQQRKLTPDRPLRTLGTRRVIAELASKQAATADQAVEELTRRGLSKEEIRIASQLAASQVEVRLGLLQSLVRRTDIDIRPWLLWLAEDSEQAIRLQAVTALASLDDAAVKQALRKRLEAESDPAVVAQLRQIVERR